MLESIELLGKYSKMAYNYIRQHKLEDNFYFNDNYTYNKKISVCYMANQYGEYSCGTLLVEKDSLFGNWLAEQLFLQANSLMNNIAGNISKREYKDAITQVQKLVNHLIPNTIELAKLKTDFEKDSASNSNNIPPLEEIIIDDPDRKKRETVCQIGFIYAIYQKSTKEIIYIGKTNRDLKFRIQEHKEDIAAGREFNFEVKIDDIEFLLLWSGAFLTEWELENLEKTFIMLVSPRYNKEGRTSLYKYRSVPDKFVEEYSYIEKLNKVELLLTQLEWGISSAKNSFEKLSPHLI